MPDTADRAVRVSDRKGPNPIRAVMGLLLIGTVFAGELLSALFANRMYVGSLSGGSWIYYSQNPKGFVSIGCFFFACLALCVLALFKIFRAMIRHLGK